ncbi:MAG: hypothetical protein ACD_56C00012G0008 [uncultured bacterium]|nr:MAG: hypothetical protein ACD_56C00012G0008 [uncultured bacterium]
MTTIKSLKEIFIELHNELEKRGFKVTVSSAESNFPMLKALNPRYSHQAELVHVLCLPDGVHILIADQNGELEEGIQSVIMKHYDEHFEIGRDGQVEMLISNEMQANRDLSDVANIITRAYSLAVTSV